MHITGRISSILWTILFVFTLIVTSYVGCQVRHYFSIKDRDYISNSIVIENNGKYSITNLLNLNLYMVDIKLDYHIDRNTLMSYHMKKGFPKYWTDCSIDRPGQTLWLNKQESIDSLKCMLNAIILTK
jgi:hypothetical protein